MSERAPDPQGTDPVIDGAAPTAPRPPGPVRRSVLRHPRVVDALVATAYLVLGVQGIFSVALATGVAPPPAVAAVSVAAVLAAAIVLMVRRSRPWWAFAALWMAAVIWTAADGGGVDPVGPAIGVYTVAVYVGTSRAWIAFAGSIVAGPVVAATAAAIGGDDAVAATMTAVVNPVFALVLICATLIGVNVGTRRRYVRALLEHAATLARERDRRAELAVLDERTRIAREMHDVVAHSLTVVVTLSDGAARLVETDPARAAHTLGEIGEVGRRSLGEMRRVLGVLSRPAGTADDDDHAPLHPQPGLTDLADLLGTYESAGLPVTLRTRGRPPDDPAVGHAIHRIVQEALTNTLRHAAGARTVVVDLDHRDGTTILVRDDGGGGLSSTVPEGTGRGLIGIRERVAAFGGTVRTGPGPDGGWQVHAVLPGATTSVATTDAGT